MNKRNSDLLYAAGIFVLVATIVYVGIGILNHL